MEDMRGTLIFEPGVEEKYIVGRVFKRHRYEHDDYLSTFQIQLYNPSMDTEIGDISRVSIFYYDDAELLNDALYSEATINGTYNVKAVH